MELILSRSQAQKRGLIGTNKGVAFSLAVRVELSEAEQSLVDQYRAHEWLLIELGDGRGLTIRDLVRGYAQEVDDVTVLLEAEEEVKRMCTIFRTLLDVMSSFGGEERIEF